MRLAAAVACAAVVVALPAFGQGKTNPDLDKLAKAFVDAWNAKDAAKVAAFYADDAVLMPPNMPMVKGRSSIEAYYKQGFSQPVGKLGLQPFESRIAGDYAYEAGTSTMTMSSGRVDKGKYTVTYRRVGNAWKLAFDIFNDDAPPATR